jgi:Bacteriophage head to tail connecting protein
MMDSLPTYQQYLIRRGALTTERATWLPQYREISSFMMPRTGRFLLTDQNKGDKRYNNIIDSTGTRAVRVLSAGLMSGMTSPARPWFRLSTGDTGLMEYGPVKLWLNDVTEKMRTMFNRSNTYRSLHTLYEELALYGTAASIVLDDFEDVLRHYPSTCGEYMIATNSRGEVDTLYREFQMTVVQLVNEFGRDKVSRNVLDMYSSGRNLDAWVPVMHIIEPRVARDMNSKLAKDMAWTSNYMELQPSNQNSPATGMFLRESGFKRFPALCPRWHATGGDIYGNSPAMEALGDVKQLQHGQMRKSQAIDYKVKPPLQIPSSMKNMPLSTLPGGTMYVDDAGPHTGIRTAFDVQLDISGQLEDIRDVRQRINSTFYVDMFLMLAQQDQGQPITAREVAEKHEEKLLMLGPVLERLHNELLKPYIDIAFDRMLLAGIVPPPPKELHGAELNVDFVSMLAQAQRAIGVDSVDRLVNTVGTLATFQRNSGMAATALDNLDTDQTIDEYADMLGVNPNLIVAKDKVAIIRQDRAQAAAQAQKAAAAQQAADTAAKLGTVATPNGNAASDIISNFSGYGGPGLAAAV